MLTKSKVFTILCLLCLCGNRVYFGSFQNKTVNSKLSFQLSVLVFYPLGQIEEERKAFYGGWWKGDHIVRLPPRALGCH